MKTLCAAVLGVILALSGARLAGADDRMPKPIDAGSFDGTWYYTDPAYKIAIFMDRDPTGLLRVRYHVKTKGGSEYETDAGGYARSIDDDGNVVEVLFTTQLAGPNKMTGHYERTLHLKKKGKVVESADFEMYRAEGGRKLVVSYPVYTTEKTDPAGHTNKSSETDILRLFRKASEMVVDFDEIAF